MMSQLIAPPYNLSRLAHLLLLVTVVISHAVEKPAFKFSWLFNFGNRLDKEYDFILVGAGPAGSVVASRLSEDPKVTVLLVEAGPDDETVPLAKVPLAHLLMFFNGFNWKYHAQYEETVCRSMNNNTCPWPSGRGLGGGTNINAMLYTRGNKQDFDQWAELGNEGWSYDELLQYFIKMEKLSIKELEHDKYRGTEGNVYVGYSPYKSRGSKVFLEAGKELGYPMIDYNKPYGEGFGDAQVTIKKGRRFNSVLAYLEGAKKRNNLHIITNSMVTKVLIDSKTKTAQGVELVKQSRKHNVLARKEVILSAGTFGSAKLLMLSGVGPAEHLKSVGVKLNKDASVGDNLIEHAGASSLVFTAESARFMFVPYKYYDPRITLVVPEYFLLHDGPLSSPAVDSFAYLRTKYSENESPDVELLYIGLSYNVDFGLILRNTVGMRKDVYKKYWRDLQGKNAFTIGVMGCYPKSRGRVRLASANPNAPPVLIHNFFNDTTDLKVIIEGMKMAVKIVETKAMRDHGVRVYNKQQPGCEDLEYGTDEYWECAIRQITHQWHHQCGTCKMGPDSDPTAVVDPRLRVRGISKLRVVDSSIMPTIPAGHTQAPSYMIGEKGAAMIKEDHNLK